MALFSRVVTYTNGSVLTGPQLNAEFDNIIDKMTCAYVEDYSSDASEMGTMTDPYPAGSESLATHLQSEITNLRYAIAEHGQVDKWYKDKYKVRTVDNTDSPVTVSIDDWLIYCDDSSGAITLNLPAVASLPSGTTKSFCFVCTDGTNNVTIDANGAETIGGQTTVLLTIDQQSITIFCEDGGSEWRIIGGQYSPSPFRVAGTGTSTGLYVEPTADNANGLVDIAGSSTASTGSDSYVEFSTYLDADSTGNRLARVFCTRGASDGDSELRFYTSSGGSLDAYWTLDEDGHLYPDTNETYNIGADATEVDNVWCKTVKSGGAITLEAAATTWTVETDGDLVPSGNYNVGSASVKVGALFSGTWAHSASVYWTLNSGGDLVPNGASSYDIGVLGTNEVDNIYCVTLSQSSDERYKEIVGDLGEGLSVINKLKPIKYYSKKGKDKNTLKAGFSAQQVERDCKETYGYVKGSDEEGYGLDDSRLTPVMVKALQELSDRLDVIEEAVYAT